MNDYTSDALAWSFLGLIIGYSLGKIEISVRSFIHQHFSRSRHERT